MAEGIFQPLKRKGCVFYGDPAKYSWPPPAHGLDCNLDSLFAIGILKHIKIYNYQYAMRSSSKLHPPVTDLRCTNRIQTLEFSNFKSEVLAFGDTEGELGFYDVFRGKQTFSSKEHKGALTSVSFGSRMLLSASVDNTVKVWCTSSLKNMYTLDAGSMVYSVCPNSVHEYIIAYSTRDNIVCIDLRNPTQKLYEISACNALKSVSFISRKELVSISLNSSEPKLWDLDTGLCTKAYHDPQNGAERVHQLCVKDNYIACACEPSSVCVYHKECCYPQFSQNLVDESSLQTNEGLPPGVIELLSSTHWWNPDKQMPTAIINNICYTKRFNFIIAASNTGHIYVLST